MNINKWLPVGVLVLVLLLAGAGFFYFRGQAPVAPTTEAPVGGGAISQPVTGGTAEEVATEEGVAAEKAVREITVAGDEYSLNPSSISLAAGETVRLTFINRGSLPHNFTIDELGVASKTILAGQSDTVEFTVEEAGVYTSYCSVGTHRAQGMEGELTAE